jgi:hypothetical protein
VFEFGEDLLDRIEVGAIGRQEDAMGASGSDGLASRFAFVAAEIVENNDFARCEGGRQHLLDVQREELTIDGAIDDPYSASARMVGPPRSNKAVTPAEAGAGRTGKCDNERMSALLAIHTPRCSTA